MNLFRPIRVRLTLWYALLLAIVLIAFSVALYLALRLSLYENLDDALCNGAELVTDAPQVDAGGHLTVGPGQPLLWGDPMEGEHFWRVLDASGQVVEQTGVYEMVDSEALTKVLPIWAHCHGAGSPDAVQTVDALLMSFHKREFTCGPVPAKCRYRVAPVACRVDVLPVRAYGQRPNPTQAVHTANAVLLDLHEGEMRCCSFLRAASDQQEYHYREANLC